ncbi:helix-turn-helix domain-containing protein, partial [Ralstonia pseudosolanacearum]|uniref:helix-turn-helix domain-containing protein n=1 Tax=Ralstonia pseudosolanacearum TaxID=1310165 RepID=UPI003CE6EC4A
YAVSISSTRTDASGILADMRADISAAPAPLDNAEKAALLAALQAQQWRMTHAAEALGISRNTLYRKLRKHGIARPGG